MNALSAMGSMGAASFYVPFKKVKVWSWESYWLTQGIAAWILAPWISALLTVPEGTLLTILSEAPTSSKWLAILFGALWGVGGLTFGLSIRYLGIAMGQSIALGFCAAFGTLIPPIVAGENLLQSTSGLLMILGVGVCIAGIAIIGYAGALKSKGLSEEERKAAIKEFALKKGLIIAFFAGVMSAAFSYGFEVGKPIDAIAIKHGTNPLFQSNPTLIFILTGGFATNFIYCLYLNIKNKSYKEYFSVPAQTLLNNLFFYVFGRSTLVSSVPFLWHGEKPATGQYCPLCLEYPHDTQHCIWKHLGNCLKRVERSRSKNNGHSHHRNHCPYFINLRCKPWLTN